ncbi:MAG: tRNA (guanosine(46)-N7)-methyltransferase TrmB [Bacilli bacterium]|nr:tRNA (guanosine(46)-N7)-methyltransferase TrmB [Bacilli bacterium]
MRTKFKPWAVSYLKEHQEIILDDIEKHQNFFAKEIYIEIGSGKGDFILGMSRLYPDINFIAIEKVESVAGVMAKKIVDNDIKNVLIYPGDIVNLFSSLKDKSIGKIFLNFSDPWPKKKHAKRRLTFIKFLNEYYRLLKDYGELIFKSDNDGLYEFSLEEIKLSKFNLIDHTFDYIFDDKCDAMSEYEKKFREKGQKIHRFVLKK